MAEKKVCTKFNLTQNILNMFTLCWDPQLLWLFWLEPPWRQGWPEAAREPCAAMAHFGDCRLVGQIHERVY